MEIKTASPACSESNAILDPPRSPGSVFEGLPPATALNADFGGLFCVEMSRTRVWSSAKHRTRPRAPKSSCAPALGPPLAEWPHSPANRCFLDVSGNGLSSRLSWGAKKFNFPTWCLLTKVPTGESFVSPITWFSVLNCVPRETRCNRVAVAWVVQLPN